MIGIEPPAVSRQSVAALQQARTPGKWGNARRG